MTSSINKTPFVKGDFLNVIFNRWMLSSVDSKLMFQTNAGHMDICFTV